VNDNLYFPWDPNLKRCPNAVLDDRIWSMVAWWRDWVEFHALPYGGQDILAQPAFVVDVIRTCMETSSEVDRRHAEEDERKRRDAERKARLLAKQGFRG